MLTIKSKYETKANEYEIKENIAYVKLRKKDGTFIDTKIDAEDLKAVLEKGTWFAEWNKEFNNYLALTLNHQSVKGKTVKEKQTLHSFILATHTKTPIRHLNGDTLDNRKCNIEIYNQNTVVNDYETVDSESVYIILRDKYGRKKERVLIDSEDLDRVINSGNSWVYYMSQGEHYAVANTPNGRIYLKDFIMNTPEDMIIKCISHNTLDNRKCNLESVSVNEESLEDDESKNLTT
ncbi:hypothetical protein Ccar_03735 [Clostridium carboxidivorans P7]|uniref:HNH nuclease domain-containing protein n=1 Tax=Clostridium carboxidivorans P7 TaxID=536227 RepID=C6PYS5_9CLOT|nr:hypothetical protein [Clostridium carboxidivorans]AKN29988.1 hypothetical protein Ccar_03735 [Clostridium carboxidivorans P7]EET85606.1 conserved hypothetical protein [Clostridium carboxidivorans P7]